MKYESPISCCSYVMTKVKVFVYGQRHHRQGGYNNSSPDFRHGELKIITKQYHAHLFYICQNSLSSTCINCIKLTYNSKKIKNKKGS